jgi:predicted flap endonuclease-1-like 5' DNA nuclease
MTDPAGNNIILYVVAAVVAAALLIWLVWRSARLRARSRQRILSERSGDERPYVRPPAPPATGVTDEVATAASDVVCDVLHIDSHEPNAEAGDNLQMLKGVGPKLAARLNELGVTRFSQLAGLSENEVTLCDDRLGPFRGRIARDRLVEQAAYLARGDTDGFEARFGKLGGEG